VVLVLRGTAQMYFVPCSKRCPVQGPISAARSKSSGRACPFEVQVPHFGVVALEQLMWQRKKREQTGDFSCPSGRCTYTASQSK